MRPISRTFRPAVLGLFVLITGWAAVFATDYKIYPGTICRPTDRSKDAWVLAGGVYNRSATNLVVDCPIVKDGDHLKWLSIFVLDRNPGADIYCLLRARQLSQEGQSGQPNNDAIQVQSGKPAPGGGRLDFGPTPDYWPEDVFHSLQCAIPSVHNGLSSGIVSLMFGEKEDSSWNPPPTWWNNLDETVFPGDSCWSDREDANLESIAGSLYNVSPFQVNVTCPVLRDAPAGINNWLVIGKRSRAGGGQIGGGFFPCYLFVTDLDGTIRAFRLDPATGVGDFSPVPFYYNAAYSITCSVPPPIYNIKYGIDGIDLSER